MAFRIGQNRVNVGGMVRHPRPKGATEGISCARQTRLAPSPLLLLRCSSGPWFWLPEAAARTFGRPLASCCRRGEGGIRMSNVGGSSLPSGGVAARAATPEVSRFRLYTLRVSYLVLSVGPGGVYQAHRHPPHELGCGRARGPARLAGWDRRDRVAGVPISVADAAAGALRADLEDSLPHRLCVAAMARPRGRCGCGGRYPGLPDQRREDRVRRRCRRARRVR